MADGTQQYLENGHVPGCYALNFPAGACNCGMVREKFVGKISKGPEGDLRLDIVPASSQPSPDLEPVRRLIAATHAYGSGIGMLDLCTAAYKALPALRSLLAEVERLREENAKLKKENAAAAWWQRSVDQRDAATTKAAEEGLSHDANHRGSL